MAEIEFGTFEATEKTNPYIDTVKQLADFNDPNAAVIITADVAKIQNERFLFQRAANHIGKTARVRLVDESETVTGGEDENGEPIVTGNVKITFTLTEKHKARRGKSDQ